MKDGKSSCRANGARHTGTIISPAALKTQVAELAATIQKNFEGLM